MRLSLRRKGVVALCAILGVCLASAAASAADKTIKIAIGSTSFAWMPLYVAAGAGFFHQEGLNVEIINVPANATPIAAMLGGGADIAGIGVQAGFAAVDKGQPIKILTPMVTEYTSTILVRKGLMAEKGVDRKSPLRDRVKALTGLKLASTAIGSGPHLMYKYLFAKYDDGADVDKLAEVVPVGDSAATLAAMRRGAVDASAFSPPIPEKAVADGIGEILIDFIGGDVPEIRGAVYVVIAVTDQKLASDGPTIARFVRAIDRANKLAAGDIEAAGKAAKGFMGKMDSALYDTGVRAMQPALPTAPTVSVPGLQAFMHLLNVGGYSYPHVDVSKLVVNDFVERAVAGKP